MSKPKVLVLMATHNGQNFIEKQIQSIFSQKGCNVSLLVSDDSSTDKTVELLNNLKKIYLGIEILLNNKKFKHSGQNFYNLISKCNARDYDYIAFSDQDDIFYESKFITQINKIKNNSNVASSTAVNCFGSSNNILRQSTAFTKYDYLFEGAGQGCTFLLKKKFFLELQIFTIANIMLIKNFVFHDWITYLFARSNGYSWCYIKTPLIDYRIHNSNSFGNKYSIKGALMRFKKLFSGWYYEQVSLAFEIAHKINKHSPKLEQLSFLRIVFIILFYGRRKIFDRFAALVFIIPFFKKNKK